jgi:hypothetical protein
LHGWVHGAVSKGVCDLRARFFLAKAVPPWANGYWALSFRSVDLLPAEK